MVCILPKTDSQSSSVQELGSLLATPRKLGQSETFWFFVFKISSLHPPTTLTNVRPAPPSAAPIDTTPQLPHSLCSHFTTLSGVLHLYIYIFPVCSSVNYSMRWWASSDSCDFQNFVTWASENHVPRLIYFQPKFWVWGSPAWHTWNSA